MEGGTGQTAEDRREGGEGGGEGGGMTGTMMKTTITHKDGKNLTNSVTSLKHQFPLRKKRML